MWVATTLGFYSVVSTGRADQVMIRARARKDLVALKRRFKMDNKIYHSPKRDYLYRVLTTSTRWSQIVAALAEDTVKYTNFKDAVARVDPERAHTYLGVWSALLRIEREGDHNIKALARMGLESLNDVHRGQRMKLGSWYTRRAER